MVKKLISLVVVMVLLIGIGVAETGGLPVEVQEEVNEVLDKVVSNDQLANEVKNYVGKFVEKRGIEPEDITNVTEVDFEDLPKEVNIGNVNNANLAIYQVAYDEDESAAVDEQQMFVITYSTTELKSQGDLIIAHDKRQFLNFGSSGEMTDGFLNTATGVEGSLEAGYVMVREGSITAISTNLDVVNSGEDIEIIIYKNGEAIRFGNTIDASSTGIQKDHDVQSNGVVTFVPGDVISAYASADGAAYKSVITMVEITTTN